MKTDEIEKTEKTASGDYLRMLTCYVIWGFQPLYFHLKPDIDGLFLLMSRIFWGCVLVTTVVLLRGRLCAGNNSRIATRTRQRNFRDFS